MNIKDLIDRLIKEPKSPGSLLRLFDCKQQEFIKSTIEEWYSKQETELQLIKENATLGAKCYAYEEIIANSNFAPLIKPQKVGFYTGDKMKI